MAVIVNQKNKGVEVALWSYVKSQACPRLSKKNASAEFFIL
jgi:hypothetical protein